MKLSIIIPVYNISTFIERCILSTLNQDLNSDEYEIIIINDGSTDDSLKIIDKLILYYPFLKVYSQVNKGLSAARNTGLTKAIGEYIWFVDGDDTIAPQCLYELLERTKCKCDILAFDATAIEFEGNRLFARKPIDSYSKWNGLDFIDLNSVGPVWCNLYRKSFLDLNKLNFLDGLLHEDLDFNLRAFSLANYVEYFQKSFYLYYCNRQDSITNIMSFRRVSAHILIVTRGIEFILNSNFNNKAKRILRKIVANFFHRSLLLSISLKSVDLNQYNSLLQLNRFTIGSCLIKTNSVMSIIEGFGLIFFPKISVYTFHSAKNLQMKVKSLLKL